MNEKIKQLQNTAGIQVVRTLMRGDENTEVKLMLTQTQLDRFAELIVKECLKHAEEVEDLFIELEQESDDSHEKKRHAASAHGAYRVMDKLRQTFGVE